MTIKPLIATVIVLATAVPAWSQTAPAVTMSVDPGGRQTFAGLGASTGNWDGEYQSLTPPQRADLSRLLWRGLNLKICRLWFNLDRYSPKPGVHDLALFRRQYLASGVVADARANGVTTLLLAPDHLPPYLRSGTMANAPIDDASVEDYATLIADGVRQMRDEDHLPIQATGLANEPDMTPGQVVRGVKRLRQELDRRGLQSVAVIAPEAASVDARFYGMADALRADPDAWRALGGLASHSYNMAATDRSAGYVAGPDGGGNAKAYWMTEASDNGPETDGMTGVPAARAASLAARFLNDLNHRVTHWVHFLGLDATRPPHADDATRIIAFEANPYRATVFKKYYTYQQLSQAFDPGAVFRRTRSSLDGDMGWTYGTKPRLIAAAACNPDRSWAVGICNYTADDFRHVQGWADDKWNAEQGGHTPGQSFAVTVRVDELRGRPAVSAVVHRTNATLRNGPAETVAIRDGEVTVTVAPLELVTLRSAVP